MSNSPGSVPVPVFQHGSELDGGTGPMFWMTGGSSWMGIKELTSPNPFEQSLSGGYACELVLCWELPLSRKQLQIDHLNLGF